MLVNIQPTAQNLNAVVSVQDETHNEISRPVAA